MIEEGNAAGIGSLRDRGSTMYLCNLSEFSLAHNIASKQEVDEILAQAHKAGARIVKPAQDTFWGGYAGYFQDPDGHLWEVAWNPGWKVEQ